MCQILSPVRLWFTNYSYLNEATVANFKNDGKIHVEALFSEILFKQSNGLINVIRTLLHWKQWLRGSMLTLNMVIQTQMMLNIQASQIRQLFQKLHKLILADRKLKLHEIAEEFKISEGTVFTILHECLSMRKLCSKWVPHLLTVDQK